MYEHIAVTRTSLFDDLTQLGRILVFLRPADGRLTPYFGKLPFLLLIYCLMAVLCGLGLDVLANGWGTLTRKGLMSAGAGVLSSTVFVPFGAVAVIAGCLQWIDRRLEGAVIWLVFSMLLLPLPLASLLQGILYSHLTGLSFFVPQAGNSFFIWLFNRLPRLISHLPQLWLVLAGTVFVLRKKHPHDWQRGLYGPLTPIVLYLVLVSVTPLAYWQARYSPARSVGAAQPAKSDSKPDEHTEESSEEADDGDDDEDGFIVDEAVLYGQPRLLADKLRAITPGKPGVPEIFFLGVAASEEDVFLNEASVVEKLFKENYGTGKHSVVLANNPSTATSLPFATRESLSAALRRISNAMNGDEDVLFLFVTTHGATNHELSVKLWPFYFESITPQYLVDALNGAGISRRVVAISACYSGGFINALADENTLVITASAADRSSFGCDDKNELTYFGRAYFNEALRKTRSFADAVAEARVLIAAREKAGDYPPSLPQIAGGNGEAFRALLANLEREGR